MMMFALRRLAILLVLVAVAYCFWPRNPSLYGFEPKRIAELQVGIWKRTGEKRTQGLLGPLYEIFHGQLHLPPISSAMISLDGARALEIFFGAPDVADQEKALAPLTTAFTRLKSNTKSSFDPSVAARMKMATWALRADHAKRGELTAAWSELLGLVYGRPAAECLPAAKKFAMASKAAADNQWADARSNAEEAWTLVKAFPPPH